MNFFDRGVVVLSLGIPALLVDQVQDAGDGTAYDRCDHVDPQVVVYLLGGRIETIIFIKGLVRPVIRVIRVRVLAHSERDVAAGERWIEPKTGIL